MRYAGGKGGCFHHIINLMPPHDVYIETHLGGGNVLERKAPAASTIGIDVDAAVIDKWKDRPEYQTSDYTFICGDAGSLISEMKMTGRELIYSDPPYLMATRKGGRLYKHEMTDDQHEEWLKILKLTDCQVILSGYKSDMYMDHLEGWFHKEFPAMTRKGIVTESVWCNFTPSGKKADYRFLGDNFRERERILRKRRRWVKNFQALPEAERFAMFTELSKVIAESGEVTGNIVIKGDKIPPAGTTEMARSAGAHR